MIKNELIHEFSFTQDQVAMFAESTGDKNPIHLDDDFASKSIFKKKIIHGFLSGSVFSKIFGTIYPGTGTLYLKQSMVFLSPMFTNHKYTAKLVLLEHIPEKLRARYSTEIFDEVGKLVFTGEAVISNEIFKP